MNTKLIAAVLVAVIVVAGVGAVVLIGGGDDSPSVPGKDPGTDYEIGYFVSLSGSTFGAEVKTIECPEGIEVGISGSGISQIIEIRGIPEGETSIKVVFHDGKALTYSLRASDGNVRLIGERYDGTRIDEESEARIVYSPAGSSNWSYWTGNVDSPGVSDAVTPISRSEMKELWKIQCEVDASSTNWRTPGSAICVDDRTYYYNVADSRLHCVVTSTGSELSSVYCPSKSVYNMAIAYGDGKIFVPTSTDAGTVMRAYDAGSLEQLFISEPVKGGDVQGAITYHDGKVFFGTYYGGFACFDSEDTDESRSDEVVGARWIVEGEGWYNMVPAFFGSHCVIVEKGYSLNGAIAYSVDIDTGAVVDTMEFDREYCVAGPASYDGRVYIPLNRVSDRTITDPDSSSGKTLTIRSYAVGTDGRFDESSEKVWFSSARNGGTQSIPIIWNGRMYIGGGGATMGTDEPFTVIDIASDGTMTTAYTVSDVKTKGTASITTAYSQSSNGDAVYIYLIEYGHVNKGEASDSTSGYAEIFCLKDSVGQKRADIVFSFKPSVDQFAYQSFTISPDGYVLIRNDSTLFCYGDVSRSYGVEDLKKAIDRIVSDSEEGRVNSADVLRAESRYSAMSDSEKARVTNYQALQGLYRTVTFDVDGKLIDVRVLIGSTVIVPPVEILEGRSLTGWKYGNAEWNVSKDRVIGDMVLEAVIVAQYKVSFDSDGGSSVEAVWVAPGVPIGYIPEPTRAGYSFDGWHLGDWEYIPQESTVSGDITLKAKWLKDSVISFDSDGGDSASSMQVTYSRPIGELPTVKRSGYSFVGWYLDGTLFESGMDYPYERSITLKAVWKENTDITAEANGITVTGRIAEDAEIKFAKMPSGISTGSITMLKKAAGNDCEIFTLKVLGDGIDDTTVLEVGLPVGKALNGKEIKVYCYISKDKSVQSVSGVVENGVLKVVLTGNKSSGGSEMSLAVMPGTDLSKHEVL